MANACYCYIREVSPISNYRNSFFLTEKSLKINYKKSKNETLTTTVVDILFDLDNAVLFFCLSHINHNVNLFTVEPLFRSCRRKSPIFSLILTTLNTYGQGTLFCVPNHILSYQVVNPRRLHYLPVHQLLSRLSQT